MHKKNGHCVTLDNQNEQKFMFSAELLLHFAKPYPCISVSFSQTLNRLISSLEKNGIGKERQMKFF